MSYTSNFGVDSATRPTPELIDAAGLSSASNGSDPELVRACLSGDQAAWAALIRRYQNLIYFFPRRYGASPADAADVFQLVCTELFVALPQLRDHQSLRAWIISVAAHQAYHWKRTHVKRARREGEEPALAAPFLATPPSSALEDAQRDNAVREAIAELPPRDRELMRLLFYTDPPMPYHTVARRLGLATGSIGLTRSRCLKKLERILESRGHASARRR
jgi:RNA polymerase sigma factor (sigma-70 family)